MAKSLTLIKSLARNHTESAIKVLSGIMAQPDAPAAARVSAAEILMSRGWGKPTQPIAGDDSEDPITLRTIVTGVKRSSDDES
jgi:hypothetical protein